MTAYYDTYDYPAYWRNREYEHKAEEIALKGYFKKIGKVKTILEVGAGFGRLVPAYLNSAENIILTDPSTKSLNSARKSLGTKNIRFIESTLKNLPTHIRPHSIDIVFQSSPSHR
jgi:ubiquinone/menaquinone biosynthesis C-methylase UbiE